MRGKLAASMVYSMVREAMLAMSEVTLAVSVALFLVSQSSVCQVVQVAIKAIDGARRQVTGGASGRCCMCSSMGGDGSVGGKELAFACKVDNTEGRFPLGPSLLGIREGLPVLSGADIVL